MLVKIKYDGTMTLMDIARFCGCAPCQILGVNKVRNELELVKGQEIFVPIEFSVLVKEET